MGGNNPNLIGFARVPGGLSLALWERALAIPNGHGNGLQVLCSRLTVRPHGPSRSTHTATPIGAMRSILASRFALLLLLLAAPARADVIGLDAVHHSSTSPVLVLANGSHFDTFRATLTAEGHQLVSLSSFDAARLAGLDAVFLVGPNSERTLYSCREQAALRRFVLSGGGMVYLADGGLFSDQFVPTPISSSPPSELNSLAAGSSPKARF